MFRKIITIVVFLFLPACAWAACTGSSPTWTTDGNEWADVSECLSEGTFSGGDTVNVIAGDGAANWGSVTITEGVLLIGPGASNLTVTSHITYTPSSPANDDPFRFSAFTVNCSSSGGCFALGLISNDVPQTQIRIDNNTFTNTARTFFQTNGFYYGVFDNNTVSGGPHFDMYATNACDDWAEAENNPSTHGISPGSALNFYVEDNTFNTDDVFATAGGHGGRSVWRYNTFNWTNSGDFPSPGFDTHGNQTTVPAGTLVFEAYGNLVQGSMSSSAMELFDMRGGTYRVFFNRSDSSSSYIAFTNREDSYGCDSVSCSGAYVQRIVDSYNWNNVDAPGDPPQFSTGSGSCPGEDIAANVNFWNQDDSFDGTSGTGCGTLGSRPATCTTGVGYFATNQNCSDVDDANVGANPTTPISGTLYKCTSTDTWESYYTPYTYPHPLREESTPCTNCGVTIN